MITAEEWMASRIPNRTFMDVGGLWGIVNEKVTFAAKHNPSQLTMVDHTDNEDLWEAFEKRIEGLTVNLLNQDVESRWFVSKVGRHDVVHCNGLLYHSANPIQFLQQLAAVTNQYLMLGTITSERIGEEIGQSTSVFIPQLGGASEYLAKLYQFPPESPAYGISVKEDKWMENDKPNARPFWWLHSNSTIKTMLELVGFKVEQILPAWENRVSQFLCHKVDN